MGGVQYKLPEVFALRADGDGLNYECRGFRLVGISGSCGMSCVTFASLLLPSWTWLLVAERRLTLTASLALLMTVFASVRRSSRLHVLAAGVRSWMRFLLSSENGFTTGRTCTLRVSRPSRLESARARSRRSFLKRSLADGLNFRQLRLLILPLLLALSA